MVILKGCILLSDISNAFQWCRLIVPLGYFGENKLEVIDVPTKQNNYKENAVISLLLLMSILNINLWLET